MKRVVRVPIGPVVRLRVNPTDAMAIIDLIDHLRLFVEGMSFSHAASIALRAMLEAMRTNEVIPTRVGFEYTEMISRFPAGEVAAKVRGRQIKIKEGFELSRGGEFGGIDELAHTLNKQESQPFGEFASHASGEVRRLALDLREMLARRLVDPDNFSEAEYLQKQQQLVELTKESATPRVTRGLRIPDEPKAQE